MMPYCEFIIHNLYLRSEANNNDHWSKKHKRKIKNNFFIKAALHTTFSEKEKKLPCKIVLTRIGKRLLDEDNLVHAFKGIRDSIADFLIPGLKPGQADSDKRIEWEYAQEKGEYAVKIQIFICD